MWQPIETAPKDKLIDVWCFPPEYDDFLPDGIRFADVMWWSDEAPDGGGGWATVLDDGDWDFLEFESTNPIGYARWKVTHWMPIPEAPPAVTYWLPTPEAPPAIEAPTYFCAICHRPITGPDIEDRHSTEDGEDCHAACCTGCRIGE